MSSVTLCYMDVFEHDGWRALRWVAGFLASNVYLIVPDDSTDAVIIDAGGAARHVSRYCRDNGIEVSRIILTHHHSDHTSASRRLRRLTGAEILANWGEKSKRSKSSARSLDDGDRIDVGPLSIEVIDTPGHTRGGITLSLTGALFTGDTLFAGGVGRTDLKGGDMRTLLDSIKRLLTYPDETAIYPGHGPPSTIGREKRENPFIR